MSDNSDSFDHVEFPVSDEIDLHTFHPRDIKDLLGEYFTECIARNITRVKIAHGKGKSVQKQIVRKYLETDKRVVEFYDAPPGSGGWGATIALLREIKKAD